MHSDLIRPTGQWDDFQQCGAVGGSLKDSEVGLSDEPGVLINLARGSLFDIPLMFATLVMIALVGIALYLIVVVLERRLVGAR